jgi:putative transcriptional regulator
MKKFLFITLFFFGLNNFAQSIDLPKYYQFPENYLKGKYHETTKNFFIVATEKLKDKRFKKTVIVMLDHDEQGALGIVINKPLGEVTIGSLIKGFDKQTLKKDLLNYKVPIYWGGPLDNNKILIVHSIDYQNKKTKNYDKISISNNYKALIDIAKKKGPSKSLVIIGVSAWTEGQLEGEIDKGHWNLSEITQDILFQEKNEKKHIMATESSFMRL